MVAPILRCLREPQSVSRRFWDLCDFAPLDEEDPGWFSLESGEPVRVIGRDGAGGRFCLYDLSGDPGEALLFVSSEGQAGTIAYSLAEGVQTMIALPYWQDCLHFSGGGDIREMRKAQSRLEADLRLRLPEIEKVRRELYQAFNLAVPVAPLESLHRAVAEAQAKVVATKDGWVFNGLFNKFVVESNPRWRTSSS
jgi:hypothetical protein